MLWKAGTSIGYIPLWINYETLQYYIKSKKSPRASAYCYSEVGLLKVISPAKIQNFSITQHKTQKMIELNKNLQQLRMKLQIHVAQRQAQHEAHVVHRYDVVPLQF